jgi:hypothetical protein
MVAFGQSGRRRRKMADIPTQPAPATRPWQATIEGQLVRAVGVDAVQEVDYSDGQFSRRLHIVGGPDLGPIVLLDAPARLALLADLQAELEAAPPGTDTTGLRVFIELLNQSLAQESSGRFTPARFGTVDDEGAALYGHVVIGVDVVGTVRDAPGELSYEQHIIPLPPGRYQALSPADLTSLADSIDAAGPQDPRWATISADARQAASGAGIQASSVQNCRDWSAALERVGGGTLRIHVRGTCQYPTTGYSAHLRPSEPQGINPRVLELDLVIDEPTGIEAQHVTDVTVDYQADGDLEYSQVHIRPDGPVLSVELTG